ncbi:hypothetical protein BOX15_Mlig006310g1 [Macrostomum lignano]|uniref:Uncharacterized protein n=2 Tax=Macrostomum lignano TaxID=282301 RepID=A0A267FNW0_9PLAT|nr:hypothetical protein BOX15_Mlig006310g1 [Macrostomum lignano]
MFAVLIARRATERQRIPRVFRDRMRSHSQQPSPVATTYNKPERQTASTPRKRARPAKRKRSASKGASRMRSASRGTRKPKRSASTGAGKKRRRATRK